MQPDEARQLMNKWLDRNGPGRDQAVPSVMIIAASRRAATS